MTISEALLDEKGYFALSLFRLGVLLSPQNKTLSMEYMERAGDIRKDILAGKPDEVKTTTSSKQVEKEIKDDEELEEAYEKLIVWMLW